MDEGTLKVTNLVYNPWAYQDLYAQSTLVTNTSTAASETTSSITLEDIERAREHFTTRADAYDYHNRWTIHPYQYTTSYDVDYDTNYGSNINCTGILQYSSDHFYMPAFGHIYSHPECGFYTIGIDEGTPVSRKRREIKEQLTIIVHSRAQELRDVPENEWVAMQTLRDMITETEYRKYLRDGFISVHGQSGKVYQVFRNKAHTKVFFRGELVEEICVRLKGMAPPTDNVIAFKTMIEFDEEYFASLGNRYNMRHAA